MWKRRIVGFFHRVAYATLISFFTWLSCTFPSAFGGYDRVQTCVCYALDFPVAAFTLLTYPVRGIDVFFHQASSAGDFLTAPEVFWYHLRFALPVYVFLFYIPNIIVWGRRFLNQRSPGLVHEKSVE